MIQTLQNVFFLSLLGLKKYGMDQILCLIALFVCIFVYVCACCQLKLIENMHDCVCADKLS